MDVTVCKIFCFVDKWTVIPRTREPVFRVASPGVFDGYKRTDLCPNKGVWGGSDKRRFTVLNIFLLILLHVKYWRNKLFIYCICLFATMFYFNTPFTVMGPESGSSTMGAFTAPSITTNADRLQWTKEEKEWCLYVNACAEGGIVMRRKLMRWWA